MHEVLAIGTPEILSRFETEFNTSAAGVYESINTVSTSFLDLIDDLEAFRISVVDATPQEEPIKPKENKWDDWDKLQFAISPVLKSLDTWQRGYKIGGAKQSDTERAISKVLLGEGNGFSLFASGGIVTRPTKAIIREAVPEAVIPLDKMRGNGGQSIGIHIHGDIYGMDDFNRKIEQAVGKYSSKLRGAY